jgi:hypothetical protein
MAPPLTYVWERIFLLNDTLVLTREKFYWGEWKKIYGAYCIWNFRDVWLKRDSDERQVTVTSPQPAGSETEARRYLPEDINIYKKCCLSPDRLCGLVVRVLGYGSGGPGSIPGTTKKK